MKVGQLAKRTGLTVRTLHHYDEIGLLSPARRSAAGYRLYGDGDIARLNRIVALRQLGIPLEEIRRCLDDPAYTLPRVLRLRAVRLRDEIEEQRRLCMRIERLADRLDAAEPVSADEFLETIGAMTMVEKYYTPEQLQQIERRRVEVGDERIAQAQEDWRLLIAKVRAAMEAGTDPGSPEVQALAKQWKDLVAEFTGGDPAIGRVVKSMYDNEPELRQRTGIDAEMFAYVNRALGGC